uniref:Uncharacterized protein n=1 Tax=Cacopsylla melanoneura TaxID=428564 RepID=A0A8D8SNT7_9HEMI
MLHNKIFSRNTTKPLTPIEKFSTVQICCKGYFIGAVRPASLTLTGPDLTVNYCFQFKRGHLLEQKWRHIRLGHLLGESGHLLIRLGHFNEKENRDRDFSH